MSKADGSAQTRGDSFALLQSEDRDTAAFDSEDDSHKVPSKIPVAASPIKKQKGKATSNTPPAKKPSKVRGSHKTSASKSKQRRPADVDVVNLVGEGGVSDNSSSHGGEGENV